MRIKLCHTLSRCASRWTLRIVDGHRCCRSNCRARFWRNVTWTPTARPARPRTGYWSTLQPQRRHRELPAATDTNTNTNTSNRRARQRCADTVSHLVHMPRRLWQEAVDNKATPPTRLPLSSLYHITSHAYSHSSDLNRASLRRPCLSRMARHDTTGCCEAPAIRHRLPSPLSSTPSVSPSSEPPQAESSALSGRLFRLTTFTTVLVRVACFPDQRYLSASICMDVLAGRRV
jgi:hypothetical protein